MVELVFVCGHAAEDVQHVMVELVSVCGRAAEEQSTDVAAVTKTGTAEIVRWRQGRRVPFRTYFAQSVPKCCEYSLLASSKLAVPPSLTF